MKINPSEYKLLVVDDLEPNVVMLRSMLGHERFNVLTASCGKEALDTTLRERPDLVLLDIMLPDFDGYEVTRRIRDDERIHKTPIIFLTALNDAQSVVKGFRVGGNDFISKPFHKEELLVRINHQLALVEAKRIILRQTEELARMVETRDRLFAIIEQNLHTPLLNIERCLDNLLKETPKDRLTPKAYQSLEKSIQTAEEAVSLFNKLPVASQPINHTS